MKDNFIIKQNTRQNINTTQTDRQNNLSDLPNDMICMISSYLDEKSFYQMKTVFPKDITNDIMWKDCELSDTIKVAIYNNCRSLFMYAVERGYLLECADIDLATDLKRIWLIKKIININPELAQSAYDWSIYNVNIDVYKEDLSFRPVMLYRVVKDAPSLVTVMAKLDYKDAVEFGVGLTNNDYMSASFLIKDYNNLDLGLGYEFAQRKGLASLRENTMEFVLRYRFENKANNDTRSQAEATND